MGREKDNMSKIKVEPQEALGYQYPVQKVSYNKRDIILYALSIGCEADELRYTYELGTGNLPSQFSSSHMR